jgi:hypothetical protein
VARRPLVVVLLALGAAGAAPAQTPGNGGEILSATIPDRIYPGQRVGITVQTRNTADPANPPATTWLKDPQPLPPYPYRLGSSWTAGQGSPKGECTPSRLAGRRGEEGAGWARVTPGNADRVRTPQSTAMRMGKGLLLSGMGDRPFQ